MSGLAYTYIPLESATLIQRKHPRDIAPPGMTDIKNMIVSRSDKTLTLRPDLDEVTEYVLAFGSKLKNGSITEDEFLNSVVGLYGTGELIWITSSVPVSTDAREIKCSILDSNGVTVTVGALVDIDNSYTCTISDADTISASEDIWPGCYIKFSTSSYLYRIASVTDELSFIINESPGTVVNSDFQIYRPHNIINSDHKANIQTFGSNIIYAIPSGTNNAQLTRISGPFYTVTSEGSISPGSYDYSVDVTDTGIDSGVEDNEYPILFTKDSPVTDDTRYFGISAPKTLTGETPSIMTITAMDALNGDDWVAVTDGALAGVTDTITFGSITSDGTDLYLSGQISLLDTASFADGFEAVDGYGLGDSIEAAATWDLSDGNDAESSTIVVSDDSERAIKIAWTSGDYGYFSAGWEAADDPIGDQWGWQKSSYDIYIRFKLDFGAIDIGSPFNIGGIIQGYQSEYSPRILFGYGLGWNIYDDGTGSSDNKFGILYCSGSGSNILYSHLADITPEDGGTYWARIASVFEESDSYYYNKVKVWQGAEGDEPAEWMASKKIERWSTGNYYPVLYNRIYGYDPGEEQPSILIYEIDIDYTSKYEVDRTTFVHKFDNSVAPTFTDVSPASSFTDWRDSGRFVTNFVYDTTNSSLVLGFLDLANYDNATITSYPGSTSFIRYSIDGGANWSTPASMEGYFLRGLYYSTIDSKLYAPCVVYSEGGTYVEDWDVVIRMSDDGGATWTDYVDTDSKLGWTNPISKECGFFEDDVNWCILFPGPTSGMCIFGGTYTATAMSGTPETDPSSIKFLSSGATDGSNYDNIVFASGGSLLSYLIIDTTGETATWGGSLVGESDPGSYWSKTYPCLVASWAGRQYLSLSPQQGPSTPNNVYYAVIDISQSSGSVTDAEISVFYPISDTYRSNVFSVLSGYVVLFGTAEYDSGDDSWEYNARRIRWTAPNAITDFSGVGSGVGEVPGNGIFVDARAVNGRIVTFETSSIGALVPRGIVADPWDYDVIYEGIKILSNPCVVEDKCYFIASDGLLHVTNGISVTEAGSSFDISLYDDFDEDSPIWLVYSPKFNSLLVFYPESSDNVVYMINLVTGSVSYFTVPLSDKSYDDVPHSVVAVENSSDQRVFVSYDKYVSGIRVAATDGYEDIVIGQLSPGDEITGIDSLYSSGDDHYWYGQFETGNIFVVEEGVKVALKHVIIHTYTDSTIIDDNPDIIVEVKSLEDSDWHGPRDPEIDGAVTVTTSTCTIDSSSPPSALSNVLGTATGAAVEYNLPWIAPNCRIYTKTGSTYTACTLVTTTPDAANEYQITGTQQIKVYGTNGHTVYCFCENEPFVRAKSGDYIETDEGLHRVTSLTSYVAGTLDRYKAAGSDTDAVHYTAEQLPIGHGQIKVGVNKLVEGVQLRVKMVPRHATGETDQPTVAKITGISLGYIPLGEKTLEATGG